ncbi:MAG: hypothetical protein LBI39_03860 [Puniceicoccales bacterium]|jgi:hypothetical protein|nr:hypothetical protein [Puniceicoccales bacterium]
MNAARVRGDAFRTEINGGGGAFDFADGLTLTYDRNGILNGIKVRGEPVPTGLVKDVVLQSNNHGYRLSRLWSALTAVGVDPKNAEAIHKLALHDIGCDQRFTTFTLLFSAFCVMHWSLGNGGDIRRWILQPFQTSYGLCSAVRCLANVFRARGIEQIADSMAVASLATYGGVYLSVRALQGLAFFGGLLIINL